MYSDCGYYEGEHVFDETMNMHYFSFPYSIETGYKERINIGGIPYKYKYMAPLWDKENEEAVWYHVYEECGSTKIHFNTLDEVISELFNTSI